MHVCICVLRVVSTFNTVDMRACKIVKWKTTSFREWNIFSPDSLRTHCIHIRARGSFPTLSMFYIAIIVVFLLKHDSYIAYYIKPSLSATRYRRMLFTIKMHALLHMRSLLFFLDWKGGIVFTFEFLTVTFVFSNIFMMSRTPKPAIEPWKIIWVTRHRSWRQQQFTRVFFIFWIYTLMYPSTRAHTLMCYYIDGTDFRFLTPL